MCSSGGLCVFAVTLVGIQGHDMATRYKPVAAGRLLKCLRFCGGKRCRTEPGLYEACVVVCFPPISEAPPPLLPSPARVHAHTSVHPTVNPLPCATGFVLLQSRRI